MAELSTRLDRVSDDAILVTIAGDVGTLEAQDVSAVLGEAVALGASRLVVDLDEATFSESEGLGALLDAARAVRPRDGLVALIGARSSELRQILVTTGLEPAFVLYETRRAAFDDLDLDDPPG